MLKNFERNSYQRLWTIEFYLYFNCLVIIEIYLNFGFVIDDVICFNLNEQRARRGETCLKKKKLQGKINMKTNMKF